MDWTRYASRYLAVNNVMGGIREQGRLNEVKPPRFDSIKANERNGAQVGKLEEETFIKFITGEEPWKTSTTMLRPGIAKVGQPYLKKCKK